MLTITDLVLRYRHAVRTEGFDGKYARHWGDMIAEWEELTGWDAVAAACGHVELRLADTVIDEGIPR